jgi:hypothetical protein
MVLSGGTNIWVITGSPTRACTSSALEEYRVDIRERAEWFVLLSGVDVRGNRFRILGLVYEGKLSSVGMHLMPKSKLTKLVLRLSERNPTYTLPSRFSRRRFQILVKHAHAGHFITRI